MFKITDLKKPCVKYDICHNCQVLRISNMIMKKYRLLDMTKIENNKQVFTYFYKQKKIVK